MKDLLVIVSIIGVFILSVAGKKDETRIEFVDSNLGIIEANISFGECFSEAGLNGTEWVIRSNEDYSKLALHSLGGKKCETSTLPEVDFEKYSLLGVLSHSDCSSIYKREVIELPEVQQIIYTVNIEWSGTCKGIETDRNWVLVPKIPDDYVVDFFVNNLKAIQP